MRLGPLVERLTIQDKQDASLKRLDLLDPFAWAQRRFIDEVDRQYSAGKPVRIITLKARQLGISTITEAVLFWWCFIHPGASSLVVAHDVDTSQSLFEKARLFWETFPFRDLFEHRYLSQRRLTWEETGSTMRVATARNVRAGRGRTLHAVHASEVAFWEDPNEVMLGLRQTIPQKPGTIIVLESTANGVGNWFYDTWQAATSGDSDFVPLFFPWWEHPEYTADAVGLEPALDGPTTLEERALRKMGLDDGRLAWRRWAIRNLADNDEDQFRQEYPATPEEAFLTTGTNVFPPERLRAIFEPMDGVRGFLTRRGDTVEFKIDRTGPLRVFRWPSKDTDWGSYFVGGDPTHTTTHDGACAQVINRRRYEQVAVWHGHIDPYSFAEELAKLGLYFNTAEISTEMEGPGYGTIARLLEMNYPNLWKHRWADKEPGKLAQTYGWSTSIKRKEWLVSWLLKLVLDQDLLIHDKVTFNQMLNYARLDLGGYGPADPNGFDDAVMAMGIAALCSATEGPLVAYASQERLEPRAVDIGPPVWESWDNAAAPG